MKILHTQTKIVFQNLFRFERCGRYSDALAQLEGVWEDINALPNIEGLDAFEAAEMILRCGSLIGFDGHNKQISNAQEISKNLLTEARHRFVELNNVEKIAECENYLALAYWRTGESVEAETWLEQSLLRNISSSNNVRLYSKIIKCLILLSNKKYEEIILNLQNEENSFLSCSDNVLKGDFYNQYALALQELGQTSEALKYLELAGVYHRKSGHQIYLGAVENNLAQLYKIERRFAKAHEAIDRATKIFRKIKDRTREGFSLDTKAQIYFAEGRFNEALITIEAAIAIMLTSENLAYLVETYLTKTKILIYLDDISAATLCLFEAVQLAKANISEEAANNLVKEFENTLHEKNSFVADTIFTENKAEEETFELILPPSIAHYRNVQGIWIKNTHLEPFGLRKGSLAIVVREKIKRGDLVALSELATDAVSCGFYDADFGIVCLENGSGEPTLFDENDIKILGKIVGVCSSEKNSEGKMFVKPLTFKA